MKKTVDMIIVGGGPVGLYALYYAGLRSMSVKLIDALPEVGGQLTNLYPENDIVDVAGIPQIKAKDLVKNLKAQALKYDSEFAMGERVSEINQVGNEFEVVTDRAKHRGRTVLIAIGPGAYIPEHIFNNPQDKQEEKGLFFNPGNIGKLAGCRVLVCGGKQEAIGWAIEASTVAASVTALSWFDVYESDNARIDPDFARVDFMTPYCLKEVHGKKRIEAVTIKHTGSGEEIRLKADAIIMARGQLTNLEPVKNWGVELQGTGITVNREMCTSIPGIYAAGDIVTYPGKVTTINAGASEAAVAVNNAKAYIDPSASKQPSYTAEGK